MANNHDQFLNNLSLERVKETMRKNGELTDDLFPKRKSFSRELLSDEVLLTSYTEDDNEEVFLSLWEIDFQDNMFSKTLVLSKAESKKLYEFLKRNQDEFAE